MTKPIAYLLILLSGMSLGWLVQQTKSYDLDQVASSSESSFLKYEQRLNAIKAIRAQADQGIASSNSVDESSGEVDDTLSIQDNVLRGKDTLYKDDFEAILSVAKQKKERTSAQEATLYLYDLRSQVDYNLEELYLALIHDYVGQVEQELEERELIADLIELFRQLINLEPDYVPYYLSLTQWLIAAQEWDQAEEVLTLARFDITYNEDVELLGDMIKDLRERSQSYVVPLELIGKHYLVDVTVDQTHRLSLMLDTGASMTVVKTEFASVNMPELLEESEVLQLKTANGVVNGSTVLVPNISISDLSLSDVKLGLLPLNEFSYDGLLGMDILGRFEFRIDRENQELILTPRSS